MMKTTISTICLMLCGFSAAFPACSYPRRQALSRVSSSKPHYAVRKSSSIKSLQGKDEVRANNSEESKTVVIAGATGYIGRAVVKESVARGHTTIALVRSLSKLQSPEGKRLYGESFEGANVIEVDVEDVDALTDVMTRLDQPVDTVVSCLASPVGTKREAYAIDYQATLNCLNAARSDNVKARHFILLSAFCVQKPLLQLQQAKLKFEAELQAQSDLSWSIVRPTAFFKSVSGQLDGVQKGNPYVLFGDGKVTRCNPICENELAQFMLNTMADTSKQNKIMNIGGPDEPLTNQKLGEMMFQATGREPKFVYAPTWVFDSIIQPLQVLATVFKSEALEDAAEYGRIGKYYAVEDMLTLKPEEKYGVVTMQDHYNKIASKGQDPFTPIRATGLIATFIESLPLTAAMMVSTLYFATHPNVATAATDLNLSFLIASLSGSS